MQLKYLLIVSWLFSFAKNLENNNAVSGLSDSQFANSKIDNSLPQQKGRSLSNDDSEEDDNVDVDDTINLNLNSTAEVATNDGCSRFGDCKGIKMLSHLSPEELGWPAKTMCTDLWGWTDKRQSPYRHYIVICCEPGYSIVDVTKASSPRVVGNLRGNTPGKWRWRSVKIYKNFAYFVSDSLLSRVQILNLEEAVDGLATKTYVLPPDNGKSLTSDDSQRRRLRSRELSNEDVDEENQEEEISLNPSNVRKIPFFKSTTIYYGGGIYQSHNIAINEDSGFAYAVGGGNNCNTGLHMIDIRDPGYPKFAGCFHDPLNMYIHDVECVTYTNEHLGGKYEGREICFAFAIFSLVIVDVTDKSSPKILGRISYDGAAYIHQGWLTGDRHFLIIDDERDDPGEGIKTVIVDVRDLEDPKIAHYHVALGETFADHNQYVIKIGDHEYTVQANYNGGIRILRIVRGPVDGKSDDEIIKLEEVAFFDTNSKNNNEMDGVWSAYPFFEKDKLIITADMETGVFILRRTFDDTVESIPYAKGRATQPPTPWTNCPRIGNAKECKSNVACVWADDWQISKGWFYGCYNALPVKPTQPYRTPPGGAGSCNGLTAENCKKYPACIWNGGRCSVYND